MKLFNNKEVFIFLACGIALVLPILTASIFAFPSADDFGYAELSMNHDHWTEFKRLYMEWSGRYTSILLGFLNPMSTGSTSFYGLLIYINILLFILSNFLFINELIKKWVSKKFSFIVSIVFSGLFFNLIPSTGESVYWYSGTITYLTPLTFLQVSLAFFVSNYTKPKSWKTIMSALFMLLFLGGNEVSSFVIFAFSGLLLWILNRINHEKYAYFSKYFVVILIGAGALFFAPGNYVRLDQFDNESNLLNNFLMADVQIVRFLFSWLTNISFWLWAVFMFFMGHLLRVRGVSLKAWLSVPPLLIWLLPVIIFYAAILPSYLAMGQLGQQRTLTPALYLFLIWSSFTAIRMGYFSQLAGVLFPYFSRFVVLALFLFTGSSLLSGNNLIILDDFQSNRFTYFFEQQINRSTEINESKNIGDKTIYLQPIIHSPNSFHYLDIKKDSTHWMNKVLAKYYGFDQAILKE